MDNHFLCALLSLASHTLQEIEGCGLRDSHRAKDQQITLRTLLAYYAVYQSVHVYFNCACTKSRKPHPLRLKGVACNTNQYKCKAERGFPCTVCIASTYV